MSESIQPSSQHPVPAAGPRVAAERGSAMIIALLIMIILTLLGVTFLVLAEQEEAISVNERDHAQALYLAEAGVEFARSWFQDPTAGNPLLPAPAKFNRNMRRGATFEEEYTNTDEREDPDDDAEVRAPTNKYTGGFAGGTGGLFDKPYRGNLAYGLWGRRNSPDVLICSGNVDINSDNTNDCVNDVDVDGDGVMDVNTWIRDLNDALMVNPISGDGHVPRDMGILEIEQIRVYRPPIDFGLRTRYGIATLEAAAVKRVKGRVVTRRYVREVLQEIPFPGPSGAIEAEGRIGEGGSAGVHWGPVISAATNDNIELPGPNANFPDAAVPRTTSSRWGYHFTMNPAAFTDLEDDPAPNSPDPITTLLTEMVGVTRNGELPNNEGDIYPPVIPDPWLIFRARNQLIIPGKDPNAQAQPYPYGGSPTGGTLDSGGPNKSITGNTSSPIMKNNYENNWSHLFHHQVVRFPLVDYQTWKDIAQSGQKNMYYFKHDAGADYQKDGAGASREWLDWFDQHATPPGKPGLYFYDTTDESPPLDGGDADVIADNLTPEHNWAPNVYGEGFIYVNSSLIRTTGAPGGDTVRAKMPGEVFLDDGIDLHTASETAGDNCICIRFDDIDGCVLGIRPIRFNPTDCDPGDIKGEDCKCPAASLDAMNGDAAQLVVAKAEADTFRNGIWDVDFNNDGVSDGLERHDPDTPGFNTFVADNDGTGAGLVGNGKGFHTKTIPYYPNTSVKRNQGQKTSGTDPDWMRDPRFMNNVGALGGSARQPHEPFLNFQYPTTGTYGNPTPVTGEIKTWSGAAADHGVKTNWRAKGAYNEFNANGTTATSWTKVTRDATGAVMDLEDIGVNGILFNEGQYGGTGNLKVYGSMIVRGGYSGSGSVDVWFNEDIIKGKFPPADWKLPRVFTTARETN